MHGHACMHAYHKLKQQLVAEEARRPAQATLSLPLNACLHTTPPPPVGLHGGRSLSIVRVSCMRLGSTYGSDTYAADDAPPLSVP